MPQMSTKSAGALARAEHTIYLVAGFILVFAAGGLLISAVIETVEIFIAQEYVRAMVHLLDRVLLALMLAEIIYTVERIARTRRLEATPFLMVGIIAAVRRMLIITAESATDASLADPKFQAALLELGLLALVIILIAWAMRIVPKEQVSAS